MASAASSPVANVPRVSTREPFHIFATNGRLTVLPRLTPLKPVGFSAGSSTKPSACAAACACSGVIGSSSAAGEVEPSARCPSPARTSDS